MARRKRKTSGKQKKVGLVSITETCRALQAANFPSAIGDIQNGDYTGALDTLGDAADDASIEAIRAGVKIKAIRTVFGKMPLLTINGKGLTVV